MRLSDCTVLPSLRRGAVARAWIPVAFAAGNHEACVFLWRTVHIPRRLRPMSRSRRRRISTPCSPPFSAVTPIAVCPEPVGSPARCCRRRSSPRRNLAPRRRVLCRLRRVARQPRHPSCCRRGPAWSIRPSSTSPGPTSPGPTLPSPKPSVGRSSIRCRRRRRPRCPTIRRRPSSTTSVVTTARRHGGPRRRRRGLWWHWPRSQSEPWA